MAHLPSRALPCLLVICAALLTCASLPTQDDPPTVGVQIPQDPLSGMGHGLLVAGETDIVRRFPNEQTARPARFQPSSAAGRPLYRIHGPGGVFPTAAPGDVYFDAISTGNDLLPVDGAGRIGFPPSGSGNPTGMPSWVNVAISVGANAQGIANMPPGLRYSIPTQITADLYSYWFEYNEGTGPQFIDEAFLSDGHEHLGLLPGDDIVGLDMFMQLLADNPIDGALAVVDFMLFFSVTPSSATWLRNNAANRFSFAAGQTVNDITAATIFRTEWQPSAGAWGPVTIEYLPSQLCAQGTPPPIDVDALAYDARTFSGSGPNRGLLFSEALGGPDPNRSQLQILVRDSSGNTLFVGPARTRSGQDLRNRIGIRNVDDVDAICGKDPEADLSDYFAAPIGSSLPLTPTFGLKAERVSGGRRRPALAVQLHNLANLEATLPAAALGGTLQLHVWQVDSSNVTAPPPGDHWVQDLGSLADGQNVLAIELPDTVPGSPLIIVLQAVYLPSSSTPDPFYVSWPLAMRY